jgi:putative transposase
LWLWDVTKLKTPKKGEHYNLCVMLHIFGRYVVAWCVAPADDGDAPQGRLTIPAKTSSSP